MVAKLRVIPNPYSAMDVDGRPTGAFPAEGAAGSYIGAMLVQDGGDPPVDRLLAGEDIPTPRRFVFSDESVDVPATGHYLYGLRTRELLPADEETAREAGVPFVEPKEALEGARKKMAERYKAATGKEPAAPLTPKKPEKATAESEAR